MGSWNAQSITLGSVKGGAGTVLAVAGDGTATEDFGSGAQFTGDFNISIAGKATFHLTASDKGYVATNPNTEALKVTRSDGQPYSLPTDLFDVAGGGGSYSCSPTSLRLDTVNTIRIYSR